MITRQTLIEDLVTLLPESIRYLMERGMTVLVCGEPVWGSLEEVARERGFTDEQIDTMVAELSGLLATAGLG